MLNKDKIIGKLPFHHSIQQASNHGDMKGDHSNVKRMLHGKLYKVNWQQIIGQLNSSQFYKHFVARLI